MKLRPGRVFPADPGPAVDEAPAFRMSNDREKGQTIISAAGDAPAVPRDPTGAALAAAGRSPPPE